MPEVYNWQLGRKMLYPYEERHPKWQFTFVFNINRCLACQTCSMADKSTWLFSKGQEYMWWNNVETKPYGGYPQFYDVKITQLIEQVNPGGQVWNVRVGRKHHAPYGVFEGMTIFDAGAKVGQAAIGYIPTDQEWRFVNIYEDTATSMRALVEGIDKSGFRRDEPWRLSGSSLPEHETFFFYLQRICNHCTYPGCLAACPRKAIYKRPEDGIVLIDQNRCRGYKKCVEQCPFKKPMYRGTTRVSEKCIACYPRIEGKDPLTGGEPMETRCMAACVGKIRMQSLVRSARTACGRRIGGTPCTTRFGWSRWRSPCIRSGGRSPTASTFRRGTARGGMPGRCSARAWTTPSRSTSCRVGNCWRCCSCGAPASRSSSGTTSFRARRCSRPRSTGSGSRCTTIPCWASTSRARKWPASRSKSRSTFGRPSG